MSTSRVAAIVRARDDLVLRGVLMSAQIAALFWFAIPVGFPLDDSWIHQVVARTFAESGTLGYAPGQHGAAATSYLWAALLAVSVKWLHVSPVWWAFALSAVASVITGQLLYSLLVRTTGDASRLVKHGAVLLACTSGNVLWYAHSGMEASLLVALSMVAIWAASATARTTATATATATSTAAPGAGSSASTRLAMVSGVASGLVALTRPEGALLCILLVAYAARRRWGSRNLAALAVPQLAAGMLYVGTNLASTGHAMPATLAGRRWLWFEITSGLSAADRTVDFARFWVNRLSTYTFDSDRIVAWCFIAVAVYGALRVLRERNDGVRLLFAWAAVHTASYVVLLPTPGHGGRYQPFIPIMYCTCIALGAGYVLRDVTRLVRRALAERVAAAAVFPLLALALATTADLRRAHALAVAHIDGTELATGRYIDTLPKEAAVASFDIGGIGWATRRPIVDAGGLSDAATATLLERGRLWEHLAKRGVQYIVLPDGYERVLPFVDRYLTRLHLQDNPAVKLTMLHELETPFEQWKPGVDATWNAAPRQVVYRIVYTGKDGPPEVATPAAGVRRAVRDDEGLAPRRDRMLGERSLALLEAWGIGVDVEITSASTSTSTSTSACRVRLGPWGYDSAGCEEVADTRTLGDRLHTFTSRYLELADIGGALTAVPHAIADAKRVRDPRFHPPLAPLLLPEGPTRGASLAWGLPIILVVTGLAFALERRAAKPKAG